jgi:hypothetical protein
MNTTAAPSRFLTDSHGTYDLLSVSAITQNGNSKPPGQAILVMDGGGSIASNTPYAKAVESWQAYLSTETPKETPA